MKVVRHHWSGILYAECTESMHPKYKGHLNGPQGQVRDIDRFHHGTLLHSQHKIHVLDFAMDLLQNSLYARQSVKCAVNTGDFSAK